MQNLWRVGKNSGPILSHLLTQVDEIFRRGWRPLVLSNALAQLSISSFIQTIFATKSSSRRKTEQMYSFWPSFFWGETTPTCLWQIVTTIYYPPFGKNWLSSVCWCPSVNPGNEAECTIYEGLVKNDDPNLSCLWTKVHDILRRCRRPLYFPTHLPDYAYRVSLESNKPWKLPLSCEIVEKSWFLGPRFVGGEYTPDFRHTFSNRTHVANFGLVPFRELGRQLMKKWRIAVKPKSTDDYVGA